MKKIIICISCFFVFCLFFSGCESENVLKNSDKTEENVSEYNNHTAEIPYLIVDKDYNVIGNNHFEDVKCIDLSIDTRFHLGLNYMSSDEQKKWKDKGIKIASNAFENCSKLQKVFVSSDSNITDVEEGAFQDCAEDLTVFCKKEGNLWKNLQNMGISVEDVKPFEEQEQREDNIYNYPKRYAEEEDYFLLNTQMSLVGYISYLFSDTSGKSNAVMKLPDETKKIGKLTFAHALAEGGEIIIPERVEEIEEMAFMTSEFRKITFEGNKLTKIGDGAFMTNGLHLEKLEIPEGVEYIGERVFDGTFVKEIDMPKTAKYVGKKFMELSTNKLVVNGKNTQFEMWLSNTLWEKKDIKTKVYCYKGSEAEKFFTKLGCKVVYLE